MGDDDSADEEGEDEVQGGDEDEQGLRLKP